MYARPLSRARASWGFAVMLGQGRNLPTHDRDVYLYAIAGILCLAVGAALLAYVRRKSR